MEGCIFEFIVPSSGSPARASGFGGLKWSRVTLQRTACLGVPLALLVFTCSVLPPLGFAELVGSSGVEPPTSRLSGARSNLLSYEPMGQSLPASLYHFTRFGGDDGIRTHDPLLAGQVLSQLSYTPIWYFLWLGFLFCFE